MSVFAQDTERFVAELDAAAQAHIDWSRRVLRCVVLRTPPGDDVLATDAHQCCRFGRWLNAERERIDALEPEAAARVLQTHEQMHDAVRRICSDGLAGRSVQPADLDAFDDTQSRLVADLGRLKTAALARCARHDALTGLPLRYGLEEEFARAKAWSERSGHLLVLLMTDIDHFKVVNDRHGHAVGDQALCHVARVLQAQTRASEQIFRFGGEEFLVMLHVADHLAAGAAAERFLQALRDRPCVLADGTRIPLRLSAGLCVVAHDEPMAAALERSDQALYAAKRAGRDQWAWRSLPSEGDGAAPGVPDRAA